MGKKARKAVKTEHAHKVWLAAKYEKFLPALIVALGIIAYHNSLHGPFIFDDRYHIVENARIRHLWPPWPLIADTSRPVIYLSLALNYALGGLNPLSYHIFNAVVHVLAALVLYGILRRTFLTAPLERQWGTAAALLSAIIASIWVVHPLQTESVTYTIQRGESMMGLFYLLTLYCAIRSYAPSGGMWWKAAAVASCALGMGCKGVMATAPIIVLLYDRVFLSKSWVDLARRRWGLYAALAMAWALYPLMLASAPPAEWKESAGFGYLGVTPLRYAMTQPEVILHYLRLAVWPGPLCFDYGWPPAHSFDDALPSLILVGGLLAATIWAWRRNPPLGFLGAWFFIILIPTSSFIPIADLAVEHRMYLSLAAVATLAVVGASLLVRGRRLGGVAAVLVVVILAALTIRRNTDYSSELAIEADTASQSPHNPRAQYDLGVALEHTGNLTDAIAHYELALQDNPDYVDALTNLGYLLSVSGRPGDAVEPLQHALRIKPGLAEAHNNLGHALVQEGKVQEAVREFEQAIHLKPDFWPAHNNLAIVFAQEGNLPEAIGQWQEAARINPDSADPQDNLAYALSQQGKIREAIPHYEQALRIKPDDFRARINFAGLLATAPLTQGGDPARAVELAEGACGSHRDAGCLETLAVAYSAANRVGDAIRVDQDALDLARSSGQTDLARRIEASLARYQGQGKR